MWLSGNYTKAFEILKNTQLNSKSFLSAVMEDVGKVLITVEQYYQNDFENALSLELDRFNNSINDFVDRNVWDKTLQYNIGNFVLYNQDIYVCIQQNQNKVPTDQNYWIYLGLKGEKGAYGTGTTLKYQWNNIFDYSVNDVVYHKERLWVAIQNNTGEEPSEQSKYWTIFVNVPKTKIFVSETEPEILHQGLIWMKITQ